MNFKAIIEIPQDSYYKYEVNKETGKLVLDRVIKLSYPHNYGYIPNTMCDDNDPIDVFVISESPIPPLTEVKLNIVGILKCTDNGEQDDKVLATIEGDPFYGRLGQEIRAEFIIISIESFLNGYKQGFKVNGRGDAEEAKKIIQQSILKYNEFGY